MRKLHLFTDKSPESSINQFWFSCFHFVCVKRVLCFVCVVGQFSAVQLKLNYSSQTHRELKKLYGNRRIEAESVRTSSRKSNTQETTSNSLNNFSLYLGCEAIMSPSRPANTQELTNWTYSCARLESLHRKASEQSRWSRTKGEKAQMEEWEIENVI